MGRLALIGGHGLHSLQPFEGARKRQLTTERGKVEVLDGSSHVMLARHGIDAYTPAHIVDHLRNLEALLAADCDRVLGICSVGALRAELDIGSFLCPDDFIALGQVGATFDDERGHVVPALDSTWRRVVLDAWGAATDEPIGEAGVYWQSSGPRFETRAEIRLIARHADVVGMTMASECIAACQLGLPYAAVCVVDNLANGIGKAPLTRDQYESGHAANRKRLAAVLGAVLASLAGQSW